LKLLVVTGGVAKGRKLKLPDRKVTRPTSQIIRESIFAIINNLQPDFIDVIDLYAGSGMLGIEALSRGAEHCIFVESNRSVSRLIRTNLHTTSLFDRSKIINASVGKWKLVTKDVSTLILADPPFNDELKWINIEKSLGDLSFHKEVLLVIEHFHKDAAPKKNSGLELYQSRRHGDSRISFYKN
jgi:16S rRNA (guanine966-N2)-methyltransferase